MDQGDNDSDCRILEEDEDQPQLPAEPLAEQEEQGIFVCSDRNIFEQDEPPPVPASQSSLYGMSQLIRDFNIQTPEDPEVPPYSPRMEAALRPVSLDWSAEVEHNAHLSPVLEEDEQDVGHFQDPCLPPPPAEPIPLDQGNGVQSQPSEHF